MENQIVIAGSGIVPAENDKVWALCERLKLDWAVKKEHLLLPNGLDSGFYGVVRSDKGIVFQACKDTYEVFQNWEVAEIVLQVAERMGATVERGGMFDEGAKTFMQIGLPDFKVNGDTVRRWATGINSFDGSTALKWGEQGTTISCANTFWAAYRALDTSVKHTRNMRDAVDRSLRALERIEEADKTLYELFTNMYHTSVTEAQVKKVVEIVTGVDVSKSKQTADADYSQRRINTAKDLTTSLVTELSNKGDTLWGLWCGVTHFTTHKAGTERTRDKSKLMGSLQRVDQDVLDEIALYFQGKGKLIYNI